LIVVGALVVFGCIAVGIAVAVFLHSDGGKKVAGVIGEGIKMSTDAQNAPGARELTKAGCSQGLVLDLERSWAFAQAFVGDGSAEKPKLDFPSGPFVVQVKMMTETRPRCTSLYRSGGEFLKDLSKVWR
jgi:hypothetical protein